MKASHLKKWAPLLLPTIGFFIGYKLDRHYDEQMTTFRNKSMLFGGRKLKPSETGWEY